MARRNINDRVNYEYSALSHPPESRENRYKDLSTTARNVSPVKARLTSDSSGFGVDERELIIKKLKEEILVARSKEKEVVILENYLNELTEKLKIASNELRRREVEAREITENSHRSLNELKKEMEVLKMDLKNKSVELGEKESILLEMKRHLAKRNSEIEKLKKETMFLTDEKEANILTNENEFYRLKEMEAELIRIESTNQDYEERISKVNSKIGEVKIYIAELQDDSRILKDRLKKHEQENNNISDDLNTKQESIDDLEKVFSDEHDHIKNHIDLFIELEHRNEKLLTGIRHSISLCKAENEKSNELTVNLQKCDKNIVLLNKDQKNLDDEIVNFSRDNKELKIVNQKMVGDLGKCQNHYEVLLKINAQIQEELEKYLREDEHIISVIKKKRAVNLIPIKESRKVLERAQF